MILESLIYLALAQDPPQPPQDQQPITIEEVVVVTATRTDRRIEDEPLRVEVVPAEEVQEKIMMTPGDVSMLLNETNGLRVQTTSPSLGGASVRIQGLRGRYTQILADGLPLYGGQTGSLGLLQIPPMDLGQVEVIKGVASALYGVSAIGGVVNLVSRRPAPGAPQREVLLNRTSHDGTDGLLWLAQPLNVRWGYTLLAGMHWQERSDLDADGWTDLPMYQRALVRPRLFWENGAGRSVLMALGGMTERRRGGTRPGTTAPDGLASPEDLETTRMDGGGVARFVLSGRRVLAVRSSATLQRHRHVFGGVSERDSHGTVFGEASMTGVVGRHTWVTGSALQHDRYASTDVPRFDFDHWIPGVFAQDEIGVTPRISLSASGRLDVHNVYGAFLSPRVSVLARTGGPWSLRLSAGRGYFTPSPFTEETETTGLLRVAPLGDLTAERADSVSGDATWARSGLEVTGTFFYSRIRGALTLEPTASAAGVVREPPLLPLEIVNASGFTRTRGTEFIARYRADELDVIATHMFVWSTEPPGREVALNPRHTASFDVLREVGAVRIGVELFYTGRQALEDNPYRRRGSPYVLYGGLIDWQLTERLRAFVNAENLGDVRQTKRDRLVRSGRDWQGRWTVDAWAPLEGRTFNAGVRLRF